MKNSLVWFALAVLPITGCTSVSNKPVELKAGAKNVGIVVFDGLFITELTAPFDVYKHAGDKLNVFTVAQTNAPFQSYEGLGLVPDYSFADCPNIDILVVPSGLHSVDSDLENASLITFIKDRAAKAQWVTSHCWGAFGLAKAGVLNGASCMTFPTSIDKLQASFPSVKAKKGQRFVVDGNRVTSGGGLAAYEAALWVVEKVLGSEQAQKVAEGLVFSDQNRSNSQHSAGGD